MRQAVVIIHGVGEHTPMGTLRSFVDAVLPEPESEEKPKFRSKPDFMSESFELRRLVAPPTRSRPRTDFYEYYWADQMQGTKYKHVFSWLWKLLWRLPKNVPNRILPVWFISWILLLVAGIFFLRGTNPTLLALFSSKKYSQIISLGTSLLLMLANIAILGFVGDAARYLSPSPENIGNRQKIRSNGIKLLRNLHDSGKYERIILVGHSLGSVIAYDVMKNLWAEMNTSHKHPKDVNQDAIKEIYDVGKNLKADPTEKEINKYRNVQESLWREQRSLGNPWLITDFITLGCPLTYAEMLLAQTENELKKRQQEHELPTCPPYDDGDYSYPLQPPYEVDGQKRSIRVLDHAAFFACTRWTNIYFPGDIIGGPVNGIFGLGIKDIRVYLKKRRLFSFLPFIHTWYWRKKKGPSEENVVKELRKSLRLDSARWLGKIGK